MSPRRILVTGASGFIGAAIARRLAQAGHAVAAGHRGRAVPASVRTAGAEPVVCDLDRPETLGPALSGADAVVHAAYGDAARMPAQMRALLAAATDAGVRRIVHLSSIAVYGGCEGRVTENAEPVGPLDAYAAGKRACEAALAAWASADPARRAVALRPGIVYGPGSPLWVVKIGRRLACGALGDLGEAGEGVAALVHVDDVAGAVVAALDNAPPGFLAASVVGSDTPTWNAYFRALAQARDLPTPQPVSAARLRLGGVLRLPALVAAKLAPGLSGGLVGGLALTPGRGERALFARKAHYDTSLARETLGWTPRIGLAEGLAGLRAAQETSPVP